MKYISKRNFSYNKLVGLFIVGLSSELLAAGGGGIFKC